MKNKDKYDLRDLNADISYKINGCGRRALDSRKIKIFFKGEVIHEEKTEDRLVPVLMKWLEDDDGK